MCSIGGVLRHGREVRASIGTGLACGALVQGWRAVSNSGPTLYHAGQGICGHWRKVRVNNGRVWRHVWDQFTQFWINVGPTSAKLAQHWPSVGTLYCVSWGAHQCVSLWAARSVTKKRNSWNLQKNQIPPHDRSAIGNVPSHPETTPQNCTLTLS